MRSLLASSLVLAGLTSFAGAEPRTHDGFQFSLTGGLGYLNVSAANDTSISGVTIPNVGLMLGTTVTSKLTVGGGFFVDYSSGASLEQGGQSADLPGAQMLIALGAYGDYYLDPRGGLHFQGFLGWGGIETTEGTGGSDPTGLTVAVGGGYDMFLTDTLSVGGLVRLTYGSYSLGGQDYSTIAPSVLGTLTWQ